MILNVASSHATFCWTMSTSYWPWATAPSFSRQAWPAISILKSLSRGLSGCVAGGEAVPTHFTETWYVMQGYEVRPSGGITTEQLMELPGKIEGGDGGCAFGRAKRTDTRLGPRALGRP